MNANPAFKAYQDSTPMQPAPDPTVLAGGRREPPSLPVGLLPPGLSNIATDLAAECAAPVDYVACGMLSAAASAIGGSRWIRTYRGHHWIEPSVLWIGAVGDPSSGKSPALEAAINPLRDIERQFARGFGETVRQWETASLTAKLEHDAWEASVKDAHKQGLSAPTKPESAVAPLKPSRPRLVVQDITPESVAEKLVSNRRLMCYRDELTGWFVGLERYNAGGRTQWLEAFGGRPFVVDRKSSDIPFIIPFNGVTVVGGIQPDKLASVVIAGDDDGLAARFVWTWPRPVQYQRPRNVLDTAKWTEALRRLVNLSYAKDEDGEDCPLTLPLSDQAADMFETWRTGIRASAHDGGAIFKSFVGKLPGVLLRLALVLEMLDWAVCGGAEPTSVSAATLQRACEFVECYAKPMAMRVFGDAALPVAERHAATLARHIVKTKARTINLRTILRLRLSGLASSEQVQAAAQVLEEANWLTEDGSRAGGNPGRKSKDYGVNPLVHTMTHVELE